MPDHLYLRYSLAIKRSFILTFFILLNTSVFSQSLSGNYTIGGSSPDYQTLNDAVYALITNGVTGPVIFKIRSGVYEEQIEIPDFLGSSDSNTVIFQSETGKKEDVVIQHMHDNWSTDVNFTISITGSDHLIFKNLTIAAVKDPAWAADYNRVIYITENSNHIKFENNIILSWYVADDNAPYHQCVFVGTDYNTSTLNDSISFIKNTIIGGHHGISIQGYYGETEVEATKYIIKDNIFREQCGGGLYMFHTKNSVIKNNRFYSTDNFACYYTGISIESHEDTLVVDGNYLKLAESGTGILITGVKSGKTNFQQVSNNAIIINQTESFRIPIGISSTYNDSLLIAHNAVNLDFADTVGYCIYSSSDTMQLYNNQLMH